MKPFEKQPTEYIGEEGEQLLIDWLIWDLYQQRKRIINENNKTYFNSPLDNYHENETLKTIIDNGELTLNIGFDDYETKVAIDFKFNFIYILKALEDDKKGNIICPYKVNCINTTFTKEADFSCATFSVDANFIFTIFSGVSNFHCATFSVGASFYSATFSGDTDFESAIFSGVSNFESAIFSGVSNFESATFSGVSNFHCATFSVGADFSCATFSVDANFIFTIFSGVSNFHCATFSVGASFYSATFSGDTDFSSATFSGSSFFWQTPFRGEANFRFIKFENTITFDSIKLNANESYMIFSNINCDDENSKIEIINTAINGRIDFNNVKLNKINLEGSNVIGLMNRINFEAEPANSDTARILKHEAIKVSNTIEALKFKAIEAELHEKELLDNPDKTIQNWAEIFSLKLSKLSNNHGQDWMTAFAFTLITGFVFFSLSQAVLTYTLFQMLFFSYILSICSIYLLIVFGSIISLCENKKKYTILFNSLIVLIFFIIFNILMSAFIDINKFFISYFSYLNPTNFNLLIEMSKNTNCYPNTIINIISIVFYLLGKISIGYGIFEIIQAFRKFNTKGN